MKVQKLFEDLENIDPTWENLGTKMFHLIFQLAPECLQLFPFRDDCEAEYEKKLLKHSSRIWKVLHTIIKDWGSDENEEFLMRLSRTHNLNDVIPEHYELMKYSIEETIS